jgi:hypothetical protein
MSAKCQWQHEPRVGVTVRSLFDRRQDGRTLVFNEYDEKLRRLRLAGVATDNVNVIWTFIEGLTRVTGSAPPRQAASSPLVGGVRLCLVGTGSL